MPGYPVVQSGNYLMEIDTGYDWGSFTLDNTEKGVLNNTTYTLGPNVTYADVTNGVLSVRVMRGRRDIGDQFTYGTMSFVLNNTKAQGAFAPFDTTSPYYDPANSQPGLAPLRNVRLSRYDQSNNQVFLFVGKIVDYNLTYNLGGIDTVSVVCADDFYILAQTYLNEWTTTEELASVRMDAMLSLPEVNYPTGVTHRNIQTSQTTLGGGGPYKVTKGTSVATYANEINKAEQGRVFVSRAGVFTFEPRIGNTLSGSVADFHDDGTKIKYNGVGVKFEATQVCNYASVTTLQGGTAQVAQDTASQAKYLTQTQYITNSLLHNDAGALALANYLIVGEPEARFSDLETEYLMMTTTQRDTVSTIDIGDTITIQKQIQTGATTFEQFAQELSVEGIEFNINFSRGHNVTFYTAPTTVVYQLILDSATYGTIDSLNVLG